MSSFVNLMNKRHSLKDRELKITKKAPSKIKETHIVMTKGEK